MKIPNHLWVALSNWFSRAGSVATQIICLPILSNALDDSEFAAYAISSSLLVWFNLLDFGFANSGQNYIAESKAKNEAIGSYITALGLFGFTLLLVLCGLLIPLSEPLSHLLFSKITFTTQPDLQLLFLVCGTCFICNMLGIIAQKTLYALGKGVYANLVSFLNNITFLALLWGIAQHTEPSARLLMCVAAYMLPMATTGLIALLSVTLAFGSWDFRSIYAHFVLLFKRANQFWLFALLAAAVLNIDYLIMSQSLKPNDIASYNVLFRIYAVGLTLYTGLLASIYPLFSAMGVTNNWQGIKRYIRIYLLFGLGALLICSILAIPLLPEILQILTPGLSIQIPIETLLLFSLYIGLRIWSDTYGNVLQALNKVSIFLKIVPIQAAISVPAQLLLIPILGVNGVLLGLICSFTLTVAWILPWQLNKHCKLTIKYDY